MISGKDYGNVQETKFIECLIRFWRSKVKSIKEIIKMDDVHDFL